MFLEKGCILPREFVKIDIMYVWHNNECQVHSICGNLLWVFILMMDETISIPIYM